jgi:hypothetical protein
MSILGSSGRHSIHISYGMQISVSSSEEQDKKFMAIALEEAQKGYDEGGIPVCFDTT